MYRNAYLQLKKRSISDNLFKYDFFFQKIKDCNILPTVTYSEKLHIYAFYSERLKYNQK